MTWYRVLLWPGAGYGLDAFTVEAPSEYDALEEIARNLRGTVYVIDSDEYDRLAQEFGLDYVYDAYVSVDNGDYIFAENMRIERIDGPYGRRCSRCGFTDPDRELGPTVCPICGGPMRARGKATKTGAKSGSVRSKGGRR